MNAQALTVPVTRISVPALLIAAAGTAAAVSLAAVALDERTLIDRSSPTVQPAEVEPQTPGDAYVEQLIQRHNAYEQSVGRR